MLDTTTTSKRDVVAKKHVKAKAIFKHTSALSIAGNSKKRKTVDAKPTKACIAKQALLVIRLLVVLNCPLNFCASDYLTFNSLTSSLSNG